MSDEAILRIVKALITKIEHKKYSLLSSLVGINLIDLKSLRPEPENSFYKFVWTETFAKIDRKREFLIDNNKNIPVKDLVLLIRLYEQMVLKNNKDYERKELFNSSFLKINFPLIDS